MSEETSKLTAEESENAYTKAAFPELHTKKLIVRGLGEAQLTPLTIRDAKRLAELVKPVAASFQRASKGELPPEGQSLDDDVSSLLCSAASFILMKYFRSANPTPMWCEECLSMEEVKMVIETQLQLNSDNNFLLLPLRSIVDLLENLREMAHLQTEQQVRYLLSKLPANAGTSPLTNSSPVTPSDKSSSAEPQPLQ